MILGSNTPWAKGPTNFLVFFNKKRNSAMAQDGPRMDQNRPDMTPKRPGIDFEKQKKTHTNMILWAKVAPTRPQHDLGLTFKII